jgi:tetratricopeptide (TPR) repeat protein
MKNWKIWGAVFISMLFISSICIWIFRENISNFWQKSSFVNISQKSGVKRRPSYIGRIHEAQKLIEHEYYSLASIELSAAIREKPELFEPYFHLSEIYLRTSDFEKLENLIEELRKKFPNRKSDIFVIEGRKLIGEKKFAEAKNILDSVGEKLPPTLRFYQASLLSLQNDHQAAKKILNSLKDLPVEKEGLKISSTGIQANMFENSETLRFETAEKVKQFSEIYDQFDKIIEGKNPHLFAMISKVLAENNEAVLALEFADTAIREDVEYVDAWILRGYSNYLLKNFDNALSDLRHAYELDPLRAETHYFLALVLDETGNEEEAILFFEKSLENDFDFSDRVRWKLVDLFLKKEKYDRVIELYRELLDGESAPDKFINAVHLSIDVLKRPEVALEITEKLLAEKPNDVFTINMYAWALIANKKFHDAELALKKADKIMPENPRTLLNFGLLFEEQNEFSKAKEFYKTAYEIGEKQAPNFSAVTNLAAEKHNKLVNRDENPEAPENLDKQEHSP